MSLSKKITFLDVLVIFLFLLVSIYFFKKYYFGFLNDNYNVVVFFKDNVIYRDLLSKDNTIKVGEVIIEIKNKKVRVLSSNCPYKICVNTGWIEKPFQTITCVPNRVHIKIESIKPLGFDSIAY